MDDRQTRVEFPAPGGFEWKLAAAKILYQYGGLAGTCGPRLIGVLRGLIQDDALGQIADLLRVLF
ncbi:MAG: hypothetical protein P8172_11925 [Gammaproteobacteria bacterium]|jgi:hypothetical protein